MSRFISVLFCILFFISPVFSLDYDFSSTKRVPVKVSITKEISTKMPIYEGQTLSFKVLNDVCYYNLNLRSGDIITGKVECIITSGMNGFPAEIILDNFEIPNVRQSQLIGTYTKTGTNRCFWVYPLKWALTPLPPTGSLTNLIKGGHAVVKTNDVITLYYYPEWK